jgi:hypothetical protein
MISEKPHDTATKLAVDIRIAVKSSEWEQRNMRALGASWEAAYASSYRVLDDVLHLARNPMPAIVLTRFRPLSANELLGKDN